MMFLSAFWTAYVPILLVAAWSLAERTRLSLRAALPRRQLPTM
jgi:hypothetical protein